jgi:general stress protein YciG
MKHKHHIIPKHLGGDDSPDNIAELTIEEHTEEHRRMYEEEGRWQDYLAWQGLAGLMSKQDIITELLSQAGKKGGRIRSDSLSKERLSEIGKMGAIANWEKNENKMRELLLQNSHRSKKLKEETGKGLGGIPADKWIWVTNGKINTKILKSEKIPDGYKQGRTKSWKTGSSNKPKEIIACPVCNRKGGKPVMKRYHFDNCKGLEYWKDK